MSATSNVMSKCFICKREHDYKVIRTINTFGGSMDLDTRPSQMMRDVMHLELQECPTCGYVATDVSKETEVIREYLQSHEYLSCNELNFKSDIAKKFYRYYMLSLKENNNDKALWASLRASWFSDDVKDKKSANICRKQCVELISQIDLEDKSEDLLIMKTDLLRRMGCFKYVVNQYEGIKLENDLLQILIDFEVARSKRRDTKAYTVAEVVKGKFNSKKDIINNKVEKRRIILARLIQKLKHDES